MRFNTGLIRAVGLSLFCGYTAHAQGLGLYVHAGSLGAGGEVGYAVSKSLTARAGANFAAYGLTETLEDGDFDVDADLNFLSLSALVDYHPGGSIFRLSGGLLYNANEVSGTLVANRTYTVGNRIYSPSQVGSLTTTLGGKSKINPYAGLGIGRVVPRRRLGASLDVGVLYWGGLAIDMEGTGAVSPTADQAVIWERKLKNDQFFPVLHLGLTFRIAG